MIEKLKIGTYKKNELITIMLIIEDKTISFIGSIYGIADGQIINGTWDEKKEEWKMNGLDKKNISELFIKEEDFDKIIYYWKNYHLKMVSEEIIDDLKCIWGIN